MAPLSDDDVREILRIIDESDLDELRVETEGFSLHVRKGPGGGMSSAAGSEHRPAVEDTPPPSSAPPSDDSPPTAVEDGLVAVESPMLGTFYRAESPGATPFVEVGAEVGPDTTVCIIEVMKMMNSVPAGVSGVVAEVVAENGQLVEFGEPLFRITPD
ncbi:MAG TPA: acetyl-CoA carboxylase biotin carboxyl carrier protein [Solirubrobacteraceae bacterium]|jgi:acetyl-CoA carboxylase biotin carboxyl carrier protein|nr:acetyl-CoA carboxylase biotin carboxyl carrier protein [Solirubrobacteraceae bacterium]